MNHVSLTLGAESLLLSHEKVVWLPAHRTLLVADIHLGKGALFRDRGVAVPSGTSADDLRRLSSTIAQFDASRLICLGDLVHNRPTAALIDQVAQWRSAHPGVAMTLVRGNHDRYVPELPAEWNIEESCTMTVGSLALHHEPPEDTTAPAVAGHLHPALRIRDGRRDSLRMPVFWQRGRQLVLPSFGGFTGGWNIKPAKSDRVFLVLEDAVAEWTRPRID